MYMTDLPTGPATSRFVAVRLVFALLICSFSVLGQGGALDFSFNSSGYRYDSFPGGSDEARAIAVQADGKIIAVGHSANISGSGTDFSVARFNTDGSLDTTFGGGDGIVTTAIGPGTNQDVAQAVALQADGKIVVAGYAIGTSSGADFAVVRYNTDGSLDSTFDGDGLVTTSIGPGTNSDAAHAVAVQSDGRIVAAGYANMFGSGPDFALARYNTDGSLDSTFDGDGKVTTAVATGTNSDIAYALAIQPDGRIVATGIADGIAGSGADFAVARYNADGTLDTTFDTDGKVTTAIGPTTNTDAAYAVALQADGKIVAAGQVNGMVGTGTDFGVVRYNPDGSLDTSFDTDGKVTTAIGPSTNTDRAQAVVLQSDGKIVAVGQASGVSGGADFAAVRYNSNGSLDTSFDGDGRVTTAVGPSTQTDFAYAASIQSDGKILAAGWAFGTSGGQDFALVRYDTNGSLDPTFDADGKVTTGVGNTSSANSAIATQADGKVVVAGHVSNPTTGTDFAVIRYNSDGSLDTTFDGDGKVSTAIGLAGRQDLAHAVAVQPDGKVVVAGQAIDGAGWYYFALVRYNADGSLDTTFDGDGKVTTSDGVESGDDNAYAIALQPDGKIVVAGTASGYDFAVLRFNTDGSLDTTFDGDGRSIIDIFSLDRETAYSVALQGDGKIVAAGFANGMSGADFAVVRLNADGTLDTSFDTDGKATTAVSPSTNEDVARALMIQSDGKIVAAGYGYMGGTTGHDFALVRYNADGSLDTSFDTDGIVTTAVGPSTSTDYAYAATIQADGKIVAAGFTSSTGSSDLAFARYNADGSLDTGFSGDGIATIDLGANEYAAAIAPYGANRIAIAGSSQNFLTARMWLETVTTAAKVTVSGRVTDKRDRGVSGARITLTDEEGVSVKARTNSFGYYTITGVEVGRGYLVDASARGYTFPTKFLLVDQELTDVNFRRPSSDAASAGSTVKAASQERPIPALDVAPAPAKPTPALPANVDTKKVPVR